MKNSSPKTTEKKRTSLTANKGVVKSAGAVTLMGGTSATATAKIEVGPSKKRTFRSIVTRAFKKGAAQKPRVRDLLALLGVDGHSITGLASDFTVRQLIADHLQSEIEREIRDGVETRSFFKITIDDEDGVTPLAAPIVRFKELDDRVSKMLGEASLGAYRSSCLRIGRGTGPDASCMILSTRLIAMAERGSSNDAIGNRLRSTKAASLLKGARITVAAIEADGLHEAISWLLAVPAKAVRSCRTTNGPGWKPHDYLADHEAMVVLEALSGLPISNVVAGSDKETRALIGRVKINVAAGQRGRVRRGHVLEKGSDVWLAMYRMHKLFKLESVGVRTDLPLPKAPKRRTPDEMKKEMEIKRKRLRKSKPVPPPADTIEQ